VCGDSSSLDEIAEGAGVCEVLCTEDLDCAFLDEKEQEKAHVCRSGFCRTDEQPDKPSERNVSTVVCPAGRLFVPAALSPDGLGYCLDQTEVTVEAFTACVDAGTCAPPATGNFLTAGRESHPMHFVDVAQAQAFCGFARARLPTLLEWQAAAGGDQIDSYPWGTEVPATDDLPQRVCAFSAATTCAVDSFFAGTGSLGHVDLSGNVAEIVLTGDTFCAAGGSFESTAPELSASSCQVLDTPSATVGFRCLSDL
jgi:hypothetical protein